MMRCPKCGKNNLSQGYDIEEANKLATFPTCTMTKGCKGILPIFFAMSSPKNSQYPNGTVGEFKINLTKMTILGMVVDKH